MAQAGAETYESFFRSIDTIVAAASPDGLLTGVNRVWEAELGLPAAGAAGKPFLDFVHPDDRPIVKDRTQKTLAGERTGALAVRLLCRDGSHKRAELEISAESGRNLFYSAKTVLPQAAPAVPENDAALHALLEHFPVPMGLQTLDGRMEYFNEKYTRSYGYTVKDTPDRETWIARCAPDPAYRAEIIASFDAAFAASRDSGDQQLPPVSFLMTCANGEVRNVSVVGRISGGKILASFEDMTGQVKAEQALRESEAALRHILDAAPMSMSIVNIDGTIEYINKKAVETFGFEHSEIPNMDRWWVQAYPDEIYRKEVVERWMGKVRAAWESRSEIAGGEYTVTCKDGSKKICDIFGVVAAGKVFVMFNDVTHRVEAMKALQQSEGRLKHILDKAPIAMGILAENGKIEYLNAKFTEVMGYTTEDIPDFDAWVRTASPGEELRVKLTARWLKDLERAKAGEQIEEKEYPAKAKTGEIKVLLVRAVIIGDRAFIVFDDITARKAVEKSLRDSETALLRILDQAPLGIAIQSLDNKLEFLNRKFHEYFGYTTEDLPDLGRWAQLAYPDEAYRNKLLAFQKDQIEKSLRTGREMEEIEVKVVCKDGSRKTVRVTGVVTPDKKIISLLEDITQRSETERALRERESLYRALVETTQTGYVILDGQGKVLDANREYVRLSGYSDLKEILGRSVLEWSAPHSQKRAWEAVEIVVRDGRIANFEVDYVDRAGKFTTIEINATVVSRGGAKQILGLCRDVSARSKTEAQLRDSESLYRALVETTRTGYVVIDTTGKVIDANREYVRLTGHSDLKEIVGRSVTEWTAPDMMEQNAAAVAKCARQGHVFNFETDYIDKTGKRTPIEINATVVNRDSGPQIHTLCRDITERRRTAEELNLLNQGLEVRVRERTAELSAANEDLMQEISQRVQAEKDKAKLSEELQQAQKMEAVGRLAGGIAHDFNNILVSISGYAEFLLKSLPEGSQGREDIAEILLETEKGASLTRQLLTFSRKQPIKAKVLDLNEVVCESEKMLKRLVGANIRFEKNLAPGLDKITADSSQVAQVIMNLVLNARDAMPEGGRITLETRNAEIGADYLEMRLAPKPGHYVLLTVSDTGSGMSPAAMQHIFEPFFTTKEEGKGTGLGLPTVYGIVSQARGGIAVRSEPGKGSSFSVYFPRTLV